MREDSGVSALYPGKDFLIDSPLYRAAAAAAHGVCFLILPFCPFLVALVVVCFFVFLSLRDQHQLSCWLLMVDVLSFFFILFFIYIYTYVMCGSAVVAIDPYRQPPLSRALCYVYASDVVRNKREQTGERDGLADLHRIFFYFFKRKSNQMTRNESNSPIIFNYDQMNVFFCGGGAIRNSSVGELFIVRVNLGGIIEQRTAKPTPNLIRIYNT